MVFIKGEEMTRYAMQLVMDHWVDPHFDTSKWKYFDLSCRGRDDSDDQVMADAVEAGNEIGAIFKEPTVTPTEVQRQKLGLKRAYGSPNGAMRKGWNGITISRDTIHIEGLRLGYKKPVFFERHAVGGEYGASFGMLGKGSVKTTFTSADGTETQVIDERVLDNNENAVVTYHNPLDNVKDLAHHFFARCLAANISPYVVTKKTVFKWQESFWLIMLDVFNENYKTQFNEKGLVDGDLQHLISDAATMQIIKWSDGGFGMAAHNYDGDMLTDEISQFHKSPGFITSCLLGKRDDGVMIKEFEASHGTVADMWDDHHNGKETSFNPLGMVEALIGAMEHANSLQGDRPEVKTFTTNMRSIIHKAMASGMGTRDLCGPSGLTTEQFVTYVGRQLSGATAEEAKALYTQEITESIFNEIDGDGDGKLTLDEATIFIARCKNL